MIEFKNCDNCTNIEVSKPFVLKTQELFENEFTMPILEAEVISAQDHIELNNINFLSTLSNGIHANIIFSFEKDLAKKLLDSFPYMQYEEEMEEEMVIETVAEFLNIVIGNAMIDVHSDARIDFSPPIAVSGESKVFYNDSFEVCNIKLTLNEGSMLIIFSTPKEEK